MKKVLIAIPCLLTGGTEVQTLYLVKALVGVGYKVSTVCYFEYSQEMCEAFRHEGCDVICLSRDGKRNSSFFKNTRFLYVGLKKIVRDFKPNVVHIQYMSPGAIPIFILKLLGVKKIVATLHTDADIYRSLTLIRFLNSFFVKVFVCTTEIAECNFFGSSYKFNDNGILGNHVHMTISNNLPLTIPTNAAIRTSVRTIGFVGRLEYIKGADLIVPIFLILHNRYPNIRFEIIGDGKQSTMMHEQAKRYKLDEIINWNGHIVQTDVFQKLRHIDILLMPSRSEGFGLTAIEAMSQGCSVIAFRTGGLGEIINDGVNGMLAEKGNIDDMANKALSIIGNPKKLENISKRAISTSELYSFGNYLRSIKLLYKQL